MNSSPQSFPTNLTEAWGALPPVRFSPKTQGKVAVLSFLSSLVL